MANHRRTTSIPIVRLSQALPPLPLSDLRPRTNNTNNTNNIPYRDDPEDEPQDAQALNHPKSNNPQKTTELNSSSTSRPPTLTLESKPPPPDYEPMYDYLRSHHRPGIVLPITYLTSTTLSSSNHSITLPSEPYRDEPFIITINSTTTTSSSSSSSDPYTDDDHPDSTQGCHHHGPPPPSYEVSEQERQQYQVMTGAMEMQTEGETEVGIYANHAEDICKFLAAMVLIALTVGAVGTAFSWGR